MAVDPNAPEERKRRNLRFVAVAVFGIAALVFGSIQLLNNIRKPLIIDQSGTSDLLSDADVAALGDLRQKDTDQDGLTDYDELYTYRTSPYLKDSDSDGIDDRTEIQGGTDPNCPQGQTCGAVSGTTGNANASTNVLNANLSGLSGGTTSAATLRETLKNAGVPQSQLDALDDETLVKLYQDVLSETPTNTTTNISLANIPANATISQSTLEQLSAADIRQLLIQAGVDANQLQTIDDVTLRAIFLQAIQGGTPTNTNQ